MKKVQSTQPTDETGFDLRAQSLGYQNLFEFLRSLSVIEVMDIQQRVAEKCLKVKAASSV